MALFRAIVAGQYSFPTRKRIGDGYGDGLEVANDLIAKLLIKPPIYRLGTSSNGKVIWDHDFFRVSTRPKIVGEGSSTRPKTQTCLPASHPRNVSNTPFLLPFLLVGDRLREYHEQEPHPPLGSHRQQPLRRQLLRQQDRRGVAGEKGPQQRQCCRLKRRDFREVRGVLSVDIGGGGGGGGGESRGGNMH